MSDIIPFVDFCKLTAISSAAMFAGGALYVNVVDVPAMNMIKDAVSFQTDFKYTFKKGGAFLPKLLVLSAASAGCVAFMTERQDRIVWLAGIGAALSPIPFTYLHMYKNIMELIADNSVKEKGEDFVRSGVAKWEREHRFRTLAGLTAFGLFLYGMYKK